MNSLWEDFNNIDRSYYRMPIKKSELFKSDFSDYSCMKFIEDHFLKGEKGEALSFDFSEK